MIKKSPGAMAKWFKAPPVRSGKLSNVGPAGSIPLGQNFDFQKILLQTMEKNFWNRLRAFPNPENASQTLIKGKGFVH
jgi:hypothetical protein